MLDPLTATSLAASVVGLVRFSLDVTSKCRELSHTGSIGTYKKLEQARNKLPGLLKGLTDELGQIESASPEPESTNSGSIESSSTEEGRSPTLDSQLLDVAKECQEAAESLQDILNSFKLDHSKKDWIKPVKTGLKGIIKEHKIKDAEAHLEKCQSVLKDGLLINLFKLHITTVEKISSVQEEVLAKLETAQERTLGEIIQSNQETMSEIEKLKQVIEYESGETRGQILENIAETADRMQQLATNNHQEAQDLASKILARLMLGTESTDQSPNQPTIERQPQTSFPDQVLKSLNYTTVGEGREDIRSAYDDTCGWILEDFCKRDPYEYKKRWLTFANWLREGNGLYWISGKPGSGKSTLMRFIYDAGKTGELLKEWSAGSPVHMASFFFWNSGERTKQNTEGLLKSLLYQVLQIDPTMVEKSSLTHLFNPVQQGLSWTNRTLRRALLQIIEHLSGKCHICFFIDGLDEFGEDWKDLIDLVRALASPKHPSIKACVSSRRENVFVTFFGGDNVPELRLEYLNEDDLRVFITRELNQLDCVRNAPQEPSTRPLQSLVHTMLQKAQGVWLWVWFTILMIQRHAEEYTSIEQVEAKLEEFPSEMTAFYEKMLSRVGIKRQRLSLKVLWVVLVLWRRVAEIIIVDPPPLLFLVFLKPLCNDYQLDTNLSSKDVRYLCRKTKAEWIDATMGMIEFLGPDTYPDSNGSDEQLQIWSGWAKSVKIDLEKCKQDELGEILAFFDQTLVTFSHETVRTFVAQETSSLPFFDPDCDQAKISYELDCAILRCCLWLVCVEMDDELDYAVLETNMALLFRSLRNALHHVLEIVGRRYQATNLADESAGVKPELDQILKQLDNCFEQWDSDMGVAFFAVELYRTYSITGSVDPLSSRNLSGVAVRDWMGALAASGFAAYVIDRFNDYKCPKEVESCGKATYLLSCAVSEGGSYSTPETLLLVEFLLRNGADPGAPVNRSSLRQGLIWYDGLDLSCWKYLMIWWAGGKSHTRGMDLKPQERIAMALIKGRVDLNSQIRFVYSRGEINPKLDLDIDLPIEIGPYSGRAVGPERGPFAFPQPIYMEAIIEVSSLWIVEQLEKNDDHIGTLPDLRREMAKRGAISKGRFIKLRLPRKYGDLDLPERLNKVAASQWPPRGFGRDLLGHLHCAFDMEKAIRADPSIAAEVIPFLEKQREHFKVTRPDLFQSDSEDDSD